MFCKQCGTECQKQSRFCPVCGETLTATDPAPVSAAVPEEPSTNFYAEPFSAPKRRSPLRFVFLGLGVCLIAALVVLLLNLGNLAARDLSKKALDAYLDHDYVELVDLVHEDIIEQALDEADMDRGEFNDYLKEEAKDDKEWAKEYNESYGYEIVGVDSIKGDDLDDLQDYYDDEYDLDIDAAKSVEVEGFSKQYGAKGYKQYQFVTIVKIDGKWYLDPDFSDISYWLEDITDGYDYDYY